MNGILERGPMLVLCTGIAMTACNRASPSIEVEAEVRKPITRAEPKGVSHKEERVPAPEKQMPSEVNTVRGATKVPKVAALSKVELHRLKMVREKLSTDQYLALQKEKLWLYGKFYSAKSFCPETAIEPSSVEIYSLAGHTGFRVVLCTGSLDGEPNVVTVFSQDGRTLSKIVDPKPSSYRIEDPKLQETTKELLKAI